MLDLDGKVVVVTGAGDGIGRGLALKAAARGANVAVADIALEAAQATADMINANGGKALAYHVDVAEAETLVAAAAAIEAEFGKINMTFNNAGVFTGGPITRTRPQDFAWVFDVNVRGLYNAINAFLPALERAAAAGDLAYIVNTGSENSIGVPTMGAFSAYTATKHAVLGITDCLRRDVAESGIRVALVCPGVVQTSLWDSKRARQDRYGGARHAPAEASSALSDGRTVEATVETVFEGLDAGEFMIITDPRIADFAQPRLDEIAAALATSAARVTTL